MDTANPSNESPAPPSGGAPLCLRMVDGPLAGETWTLSAQQPILVGRGIGCQVRVENPWVSRVHCEVRIEAGRPHLLHRSQRNPTFVNGAECPDVVLKVGDVIELPETRLIVCLDPESTGSGTAFRESADTTRTFDQAYGASGSNPAESCPWSLGHTCETHALLGFLQTLRQSESLDELVAQIRAHLCRRLEADACWVAWSARLDGDMALFPPASPEETQSAPHHILRQVCVSGRGLHSQYQSHGAAADTVAAPLMHGRGSFGAIAVERRAGRDAFSRAEFDYLQVAAESAAPLIRAAERLEQFKQDKKSEDAVWNRAPRLLGNGKAMQALRVEIQTAALARLNVMLVGETGVGKELAARMIHDLSVRANGPYVCVNCAAIPREMFESEMFGYERGAFTGATSRRKGFFEQAHGGTLFLDEIGDLDLMNQARLLRAAETHSFRRLGGDGEIFTDVRILSATNRPMPDEGATYFRQDLYHRLSGMTIRVLPLRERKEDIPELAQYFLAACSAHAQARPEAFSDQAMDRIIAYHWPGNIRELRNVVECAAYKATSRIITDIGLPGPSAIAGSPAPDSPLPLDELERMYLAQVLEQHGGAVKEAAAALGMPKSTLYYKLAKYQIKP